MKKLFRALLTAVITFTNLEFSHAVNYPSSLDDDTSLYTATNNQTTALTSAVNNSTTTIPVISTTGFPSSGLIQIDAEVIYYASKGGASFTSCTRGFDGTGAASHVDASVVEATVVAAYHEANKDANIAQQTKIGIGASTPTSNTVLRGTGTGTSAWGPIVSGDITQYTIALDRVVTGTAANMLVYNSSNVLASVALTGVLSITSTGVTSLATGSITSAAILDGEIVNADVNASAAIAFSKLAALSSGNILVGSAGNVATSVAMSGDVAISNTGATTIQANSVALTTDTTGNYAAGDAEGGAALTGDSATSFFSTGTLENARLDADLTAIGDNSTDGIYARTGAGTVSARTITGTSEEISVSNGDGVSGNPTISLPTAINLGGKKLEIPNDTALVSADCDDAAEAGRVFIDNNATTGQQFYYCEGAAGWVGISGGGSSSLTASEGGTPVDVTVTTLDFLGADFDLSESSEDVIAINIASAITRDTEWDTESEVQTAWGSVNILLETEIDASSELAALMDDESGSGALVFGTGPTISLGENSIVNTGTAPTVNAAGEFAMDTNLLGTFGAYIGFDGTNVIRFVGIINTDTCTDNQIPKFDDDTDTWTCEADSTGSGSLGSSLSSTTDDITSSGDIQLLPDGDDVSVGSSSSTDPQKVHIFDGGSDNEPGALALYGDDGTAHYLFYRTDGTLASHTSYPSDDDADGTAIGSSGFSKPQDSATDNFRLSVTVASNDLIVAVKGLDGFDPSATNVVSVRIGDTIRTITAATSVTLADATNWFNSGGAELATKEVDYFAYLVWDSNSSVVDIAIARIPYGRLVSDFSSTSSNEKYLSQYANYTSTDDVVNVGRLAATLSAGAGYTWTVPSFTAINLIQRPIYETRWLDWVPALSVASGTAPTYTQNFVNRYKLYFGNCKIQSTWTNSSGGTAGNGSATLVSTLPFSMSANIATVRQNRTVLGMGETLNNVTGGILFIARDASDATVNFNNGSTVAVTGTTQNNAVRWIIWQADYEI